MPSQQQGNRAATAATMCASAMIANQVGGKAARDALFLSNFDVSFLPFMLIGSAVFSIVFVFAGSWLLSRRGPSVLIPVAFASSAALLLGEWILLWSHPRVAAVLLYMHMASFGGVLISGFWSVVNERFDPRNAKRQIGRIAAGATFGGFMGGVLAERVAATLSVPIMIPILAVLHLFCAVTARGVGRLPNLVPLGDNPADAASDAGAQSAARLLREAPYLRNLAILVLLVTSSGAMLDYVFKARAAQAYVRGEDLLRFFAIFYTAVALGAFLVQTILSRRTLERFGVARTVGTLPLALAAGGIGAVTIPTLASAAIAKGLESITNDSLFRSGYEILYTPIPAREKRVTKSLVDVGFHRLGDLIGGGLIRLLLLVPGIVIPAALGLAIFFSAIGLWFSRHLNQGYIASLEKSLLNRTVKMDPDDVHDPATRSVILRSIHESIAPPLGASTRRSVKKSRSSRSGIPVARVPDVQHTDPVVHKLAVLRSGDLAAIRQVLTEPATLEPPLVPEVIGLVAWDDVSSDAINALRKIAPRAIGQLTDALLDEHQPFAVRRRIPQVLFLFPSPRVVEALLGGLADRRFEVRFRCGYALMLIGSENPELLPDANRVFAAVERETAVDKKIWESRRLLDLAEDAATPLFVGDLLRKRASRSLQHVFHLLSLALPRGPLSIAFKGLYAEDENLRGTALEYLETILPSGVRGALWPYLEDNRPAKTAVRSPEEILDTLVRSHESIELDLAALKMRQKT